MRFIIVALALMTMFSTASGDAGGQKYGSAFVTLDNKGCIYEHKYNWDKGCDLEGIDRFDSRSVYKPQSPEHCRDECDKRRELCTVWTYSEFSGRKWCHLYKTCKGHGRVQPHKHMERKCDESFKRPDSAGEYEECDFDINCRTRICTKGRCVDYTWVDIFSGLAQEHEIGSNWKATDFGTSMTLIILIVLAGIFGYGAGYYLNKDSTLKQSFIEFM